MTKGDLVDLYLVLSKLKGLGNTKFMYFIIKNLNIVKELVSPLLEIQKINEGIVSEFRKDKNQLILEIGVKDNGRAYIDQNDKEMFSAFSKGLESIISKHSEQLTKYEEEVNQYNLLLKEDLEEELPFRTIAIEDCPETGIESNCLELLLKYELIK